MGISFFGALKGTEYVFKLNAVNLIVDISGLYKSVNAVGITR